MSQLFGSTTCPSKSERRGGGSTSVLRVRWVFPEPRVLTLGGNQTVGRDPSCTLQLPGKEISRRHAEFQLNGPLAAICDLGSRNGVYINGRRRDTGPISPGDVVRCGEWVGVICSEADALGFREVASGWFGGATLALAFAETRNMPLDLPIVVQGETGTGKECAARAIHAASGRPGEFVAVNCAALPEHLVESQLFGHKRGAFTGADKASVGLIRSAHAGTLFLDEIQELPISVQPKLLRAIERREVVPVGEVFPQPVDVRIVSASQEPLPELVTQGRFRPDLQARLDGLTVELPPLRARREDITPLFLWFLRQQGLPTTLEVDYRLLETLCIYDWPLNVRELQLLARRLAGQCRTELVLRRDHLPSRMLDGTSKAPPAPPSTGKARSSRRPVANDDGEFESLVLAIKQHRGNVSRAAEAIGISRARAYRLLSAHPDFDTQAD